jgi:hypothetical protein
VHQPIEGRAFPPFRALGRAAAAGVLLSNLACFHLIQPQTYYLATRRVAQQRQEYLDKELMAGLPEPLFLRWYSRDASWGDDLRPYILEKGTSKGRTVYKVGTGGRVIADVYFRSGRLEEIGEWDLEQEGPLSAWFYRKTTPRRTATEPVVARLWVRDPSVEPYRPEEASDAREACPSGRGTVVETMQPLEIVREAKGPPHLTGPRGSPEGRTAPESILPAGKTLKVRRGNLLATGLLLDVETGQEYRVFSMAGSFCPAGRCAQVGEVAVVTRRLEVATLTEGDRVEAQAVVPGLPRLPVWMERLGVLEAGRRVRIRSWSPCGHRQAEVEILEPGVLPAVVKVPVAPPGLFAPIELSSRASTFLLESLDETGPHP